MKKQKSFKMTESGLADLATAIVHLDGTTEVEAVETALAFFVHGRAPIVVQPRLVPKAELGKAIQILASYHGTFSAIAHDGYPCHYDGETEQHRVLVEELRRKAKTELPKLDGYLQTLRGLRNLCSTAKDVDVRRVRVACCAIRSEMKKAEAVAQDSTATIGERDRQQHLAHHYSVILELMDHSGLWFPGDVD